VTGVNNHIIGNNDVALNAAVKKAQELGYTTHAVRSLDQGEATRTGFEMAEVSKTIRDVGWPVKAPVCLVTGGEPVVQFAKTDQPRKGGRNQQLVLSSLKYFWDDGMQNIVILSGGTDGEDGPTDAAGAVADADLIASARRLGLNPEPYLEIQNAYPFFEAAGGLLKTGPTHTNVMDLRVTIVAG
jgi:hydroxypyruvate reductase